MKILVAYPSFPEPQTNAGGLRLFEILRILVAAGHQVVFVAREDNGTHCRKALEELGIICVCDLAERLTESPAHFARFLNAHRPAVAVLVHYYIYNQYAPLIRALSPQCHCVLDTVDLHFVRVQRGATLSNDPDIAKRANEIRRQETAAMMTADSIWVVTPTERETLERKITEGRIPVHVVPCIHRVATKVPAFSPRKGVVFLGGYQHSPNVDAVNFFMNEVFPCLRRLVPDVPLTIAGSHPPDEFRKYSTQGGVCVTGFIEDHRALLHSHRVGIAPLRYGAGMKGKIGEYFACGLPTVTTAIGAEGMGLRHEEQILLAETPDAFADAIARAYLDEGLWRRLSRSGVEYVRQHLEPAAIAPYILGVLETAPPHPRSLRPMASKLLSRFTSPRRLFRFASGAWEMLRARGLRGFLAEVKLWISGRSGEE